eukprot:gene13760-biopygen8049
MAPEKVASATKELLTRAGHCTRSKQIARIACALYSTAVGALVAVLGEAVGVVVVDAAVIGDAVAVLGKAVGSAWQRRWHGGCRRGSGWRDGWRGTCVGTTRWQAMLRGPRSAFARPVEKKSGPGPSKAAHQRDGGAPGDDNWVVSPVGTIVMTKVVARVTQTLRGIRGCGARPEPTTTRQFPCPQPMEYALQ